MPPNATTGMSWLGRSEGRSRSVAVGVTPLQRASDSPSPGERMGEDGCIFDEMGNLVEPTERLH